MRRREFITLAGGAVAAWPVTAFGKPKRIALVSDSFPVSKMTEANGDSFSIAFFSELRRHGYVEGQTLLIERYSGEGRAAHYPDLVREVVRSNPDLIFVVANEITLDFKRPRPQFRSSAPFLIRSSPGLCRAWRDRAAISRGSPPVLMDRISGASGGNCCGSWYRI
jgi:hypothetical protein